MATSFLNTVTISHGSSRLACSANSLDVSTDVAILDATTFCSDGWEAKKPGLRSASLTVGGFWDLNLIDAQLAAQFGTAAATTVSNDDTEGSIAYLHEALISSHGRGGDVANLAKRDLTLQGTGRLIRGVILEPGVTNRSATGNGTGVQQGSVSSGQYAYAALHVVESNTTGTLDVTIQSDDNSGFSSATTRFTFTQAVGVTSQWATPLAGAIADDYWRARWVIAGGWVGKFVVSFGIA